MNLFESSHGPRVASLRQPKHRTGRPSRPTRPSLEALEGRALMTASTLDPSFATGGLYRSAADTGTGTAISNQTALVVQSDGKIVTVGTYQSPSSTPQLAVERFNTNGTLDTTFGTNGQVNIALPSSFTSVSLAPRSVAINATSGVIDLAATVAGSSSTNGLVVQLTSTGALDTTFATGGEYTLPASDGTLSAVAVQSNGMIVATGVRATNNGSNTIDQVLAVRLTTAGVLDTTFNGNGELAVTVPGTSTSGVTLVNPVVTIAPSGQIYLGTTENTPSSSLGTLSGMVVSVNTGGTVNTGFGSSGVLTLSSSASNAIGGLAVQSNNALVVAGSNYANANPATPFLLRFTTAGAADSSFKGLPVMANSITPSGGFNSVVIESDGKIVTGGSTTTQGQFIIERFLSTGAIDPTFGAKGRTVIAVTAPTGATSYSAALSGVALTTGNKIDFTATTAYVNSGKAFTYQGIVGQALPLFTPNQTNADYDGDGKTDISAELTAQAIFAYRRSGSNTDALQQFGQSGVGNTIPVAGDFDGDGITDIAVYLPSLGEFAYRPSSGGSDVVVAFGPQGIGAAIPAVGDYDGDGKTDFGVYIVSTGVYAYRSSATNTDLLQAFGTKGVNGSVPAPGDYDGDGKTDIAVYLPATGTLAYRSSSTGKDVLTQFGPSGVGAAIPTPGDYDGDGKTDVAIYIPSSGTFAVHPSSAAANYSFQFGASGAGASLPIPGDYDGDGKTDLAVYIPSQGVFAYRPSAGGMDVLTAFGTKGTGNTIPTLSIPYAQQSSSGGTSASRVGNSAQPAINIPLTADILDLINGTSPTKKKTTATTA